MNFSHPLFVYGIMLIPILLAWIILNQLKLKIPSLMHVPNSHKRKNILPKLTYYLPLFFLSLALIYILIALANPRKVYSNKTSDIDGVGIMLIVDMSGSMEAEDFLPNNRIAVSKKVIREFINQRPTDLIGMVVFGTDAFLVSPLTSDHLLLQKQIAALEVGQIDGQTAIGSALARGVNHLRNSTVKSKIIILLTDGENNTGDIDPITAANLSAALGIKVYTIGMGKVGGAPVPYLHPVYGKQYYRNPDGSVYMTKLDEETLKKIADLTGGTYFRATDSDALTNIYQYINKLEKTKIKNNSYTRYESKYFKFLFTGLILYIVYLLLEFTVLRIIR